MTPEQQAIVQAAADDTAGFGRQNRFARDVELVSFLKAQGPEGCEPVVAAFGENVQAACLGSDLAATRPGGILAQSIAPGN